MPTTFSRTLRIGQDYDNMAALKTAMDKGPVGGLVPGDWLKILYDDSTTAVLSDWDGTASSRITIQDNKHLLGTVTMGDYYDLYCGNDIAGLGLGTNNRVYPCGQILFSGTEALEGYQVDDDVSWWEFYHVSDGSGGWEDYRVKE
jgi:hypothetical protein